MRKIISIVIIILAIFLIALGIYWETNKKEVVKPRKEVAKVTGQLHLIGNTENKYALFNEKGKQLTEFLYGSEAVINQYGAILKSDKGSVIVSKDGKIILDETSFAKHHVAGSVYYEQISQKGQSLKRFDGSVIKSIDINKYGLTLFNHSYLLVQTAKDKQTLYDLKGNEIISLKEKKNNYMNMVNYDDVVVIKFENNNYIVNTKTNKLVNNIKNENHLCSVKVAGKLTIYSVCSSDNTTYFVNQDSKEITKFSFKDCPLKIVDNKAYCYSTEPTKTSLRITSTGNNYAEVKDKDINIYKNSKIVKTVKDASFVSPNEMAGIYTLFHKEANKYVFYDEDGKEILKNKFVSSRGFDHTGKAVVAKEYNKEYLMDKTGKKVSGEFELVNSFHDDIVYYTAIKKAKMHVLNSAGKEMYVVDNHVMKRIELDGCPVLTFEDSKTKLLDAVSPCYGLILENKPIKIVGNYLTYEEDNKIYYYTAKAEKIAVIEKR